MIFCRCAEVLPIHVSLLFIFKNIFLRVQTRTKKDGQTIAPPWLSSFSWELLITLWTNWSYLPWFSLFISSIFWQIWEWSPSLGWIPSCTHPCTFSSATSPSVTSAVPQLSAPRWWWTDLPRTSQSLSMAVLCNSWSSVSLLILSVSCCQWWPVTGTRPSAILCSIQWACPAGSAPCSCLGFSWWG